MPATTTTFDAVLKDWFLGKVRDTLNEKVTMFDIANAKAERVGGRRLVYPVHVGRNFGVGTRAERGTLPTAQNEVYVTATVSPKYWYGRIEVSAQAMKQSQGDRAAFAEAMSEEMDRMTRNSRKYFNRMLYFGSRGDLCTVASGQSSVNTTTVNVTSSTVNVGSPLRFIQAGMILDGLNASGAATDTSTVSTDFTSATVASATVGASGSSTITFSATVTVVSGTIMTLTGCGYNDFNGVNDGINSSGTYAGVSRDAYSNKSWRANILGNSGTNRPLTLNLLQQAWDAASEASGEDDTTTHLISHYSVRREYLDLLTPDVRFTAQTLKGGHKVLDFNGAEFRFEVDAPFNTVYGINAPSWHLYKISDFEWADEDGSVLSRVNNIDSFEGFMRMFGNFGTDAPNKNFRITDIQATL